MRRMLLLVPIFAVSISFPGCGDEDSGPDPVEVCPDLCQKQEECELLGNATYDECVTECLGFAESMLDTYLQALVDCSSEKTCAELTVGGRAAILVPFAQAADDHQRTNAQALQDAGAARMIEEKNLTGETLARAVTALVDDPERIRAMGEAARALGRPDAAARVADLVLGAPPKPAEVEPC